MPTLVLERPRATLAGVAPNLSNVRLRSVCHYCDGEGAVAFPRAVCLSDADGSYGYEVRLCVVCQGREWLPGVVAPV